MSGDDGGVGSGEWRSGKYLTKSCRRPKHVVFVYPSKKLTRLVGKIFVQLTSQFYFVFLFCCIFVFIFGFVFLFCIFFGQLVLCGGFSAGRQVNLLNGRHFIIIKANKLRKTDKDSLKLYLWIREMEKCSVFLLGYSRTYFKDFIAFN